MKQYKVLQHFQWGQLSLEKGQIILVTESSNGNSFVSVDSYPDKIQVISSKAVQSMLSFKKIEE